MPFRWPSTSRTIGSSFPYGSLRTWAMVDVDQDDRREPTMPLTVRLTRRSVLLGGLAAAVGVVFARPRGGFGRQPFGTSPFGG
jgi:hypothetical protein